MDIGSPAHRSMLYKTVFKMAFKTSMIAIAIGVFLRLPSLLRENTFSMTMLMLSNIVIVLGIGYALWIAWKKHRAIQKTIKSL